MPPFRSLRQGFAIVALLLSGFSVAQVTGESACLALNQTLQLPNTTLLDVSYVPANTTIDTAGSCQSTALSSSAMCRIYFVTQTSNDSAIHAEMWLPDDHNGRFLALGNGGLGGCIDYADLDYGATMHFATIGSDNGHDGDTGVYFLGHPEVIVDFAWRSIHTEAEIGKEIFKSYYNRTHHKAYYLGCSTGGRQGTQSALRFPDDFDGILAGSPATNWNNLQGWGGMLSRYIGAGLENATAQNSPSFITSDLWDVIAQEILNQCDGLDGIMDGIITEPDECQFRPQNIMCTGTNTTGCLTAAQVEAITLIHSPVYGTQGELLCSRWDPGAEAQGNWASLFSGPFAYYTIGWIENAIFNDTSFNLTAFNISDIEFMDQLDPSGIETFNGNFQAFRERGGKFLTYHGRQDQLIPADNSKRMYDIISTTLASPTLDDFYRFFLIPGMQHCDGGPGQTNFGQLSSATNLVNDTDHNALLALVNWVENGVAPDMIIGTDLNGKERVHCRYPVQKSVYNGSAFVCEDVV